jgi:hypothetical protein
MEDNTMFITPPLFWRSSYLELQSETAFFAGVTNSGFYLESRDETAFRTWIVVDNQISTFKSPCRATFGGCWAFNLKDLKEDCITIISQLAKRHPEMVHITVYLPPEFAFPFDPILMFNVFESLGSRVVYTDIDYWISPLNWSESSMSKGNQKKLRQWISSNGQISEVSLSNFESVYQVILENRHSLGVEPSISAGDLENLMLNFKDEYKLYSGTVDGDIAVVAITVQVHPRIKYVFFWADKLQYRHLSPVVAMCAHLVNTCLISNIDFLDLGISTERGIENPGLMRFKANLGALPSPKHQISIDLDSLRKSTS